MRRLLAALLLALLWATSAYADSPIPPHTWERVVGPYRFMMLAPYDGTPQASGQRQYPASGLYRATGPSKPLWTVDWYAYEDDVFLSPGGEYLVRMGPWPSGGNYDELAVAFYQSGTLTRSYVVRDLVENPETLPRSVSHYAWRGDVTYDPGQMRVAVATIPGVKYLFDVKTGEILNSASGARDGAAQADDAAKPVAERPPASRLPASIWAAGGFALAGGMWMLMKWSRRT